MKIAIAYENGNVHPHFGQCTCVKIYEIENNAVVSTGIVNMTSPGHSMITRVISVVICGNIKPGAALGLEMSDIQLFAGVTGSADKAIENYLAGTLRHYPNACRSDESCGHDELFQNKKLPK